MRYFKRFISAVLIIAIAAFCVPLPVMAQTNPSSDRVYVLGAVKKPGDFAYNAGMNVKEAIDKAGGLLDNADLKAVMLIRESGDRVPLDMQPILDGTTVVTLIAGDTIVVRPLPTDSTVTPAMTASITGEVNQPGTYVISPETKNGDTLEWLIQQAGGSTGKANMEKVRISSVKGTDHVVRVVDARQKSDREATKLQTLDAVFIPEKESKPKSRTSLNDIYLGTIIIYTLVNIFRGN